MGIFDNIGAVKASLDANYVRPGHYLFLVENGKLQQDRAGIPFVVLEMICVKVFPDAREHLPPEGGTTCHFVGERASHLIKNGGAGVDMFLPNVKAMLSGILGIPEAEITPEVAKQAFVSEGQQSQLRGLVVELNARTIITKKTNKPFTRITYKRTVPPDEYEQLGVELPAGWSE